MVRPMLYVIGNVVLKLAVADPIYLVGQINELDMWIGIEITVMNKVDDLVRDLILLTCFSETPCSDFVGRVPNTTPSLLTN